jgi:FixJ family two-component response regulator
MDPFVAVVDDDPSMRMLVRAISESAGRVVGEYPSGEDFLDRYVPRRGCIVLGVYMVRLTGLDVLRKMQRRGWAVPTVVMSGGFPAGRAFEVLELGALAFVAKPFRIDEMVGWINAAIALCPWQGEDLA